MRQFPTFFPCALILLSSLLIAPRVHAESANPAGTSQREFQSSGLRASIVGTSKNRYEISIQMLVENISKSRQYVMVPSDLTASSNLGTQFRLKEVAGISYSQDSTNSLFMFNHMDDLYKFSYIEPGESIAFSMKYFFNSSGSDFGDLFSFSFKAVVRTSPATTALNPEAVDKAGPPHIVIINFPLIPMHSN